MSRVLILAYACEPGFGSEAGVGWNWALMASRSGHEVTVLTREVNRARIESIGTDKISGLNFEYYELPRWVLAVKRRFKLNRAYYLLWCWRTRPRISRLMLTNDYDLMHHVTWATAVMPTPLRHFARPFVLGPIGGGVPAAWAPWRMFGIRGFSYEILRTISLALSRWNPQLRDTWRSATVTLAQNQETADLIRRGGGAVYAVFPNAGVEDELVGGARLDLPSGGPVECVFAGRLIHWKGAEIAIRAVARVAFSGRDVRLRVFGFGPREAWLRRLARELGAEKFIVFEGRQPRSAVLEALRRSHFFLLPSLHDEGPLAIAEAMACGATPIAVDRGGPRVSMSSVGYRIPVASVNSMVADVADVIRNGSLAPPESLRRAAKSFTWPVKQASVDAFYRACLTAAPPLGELK